VLAYQINPASILTRPYLVKVNRHEQFVVDFGFCFNRLQPSALRMAASALNSPLAKPAIATSDQSPKARFKYSFAEMRFFNWHS
jgi:hypothetical protein